MTTISLDTPRFGHLEVDPAHILHFPLGLLGFETVQRFVLIDSDDVMPMRWLLAIDEPGLTFLVVEPGQFYPHYEVRLADADQQVLEAKEAGELVVACLVVIPENPKHMTVNLMGPLVVNMATRIGKQVVMHDSDFSPRQRLIPDEASAETPALV